MVTAQDSGKLLVLLVIDRLHRPTYISSSRKINYTSQSVAMMTTYTEPSTHVYLVFYCCLATNFGTMKYVEYGTCG